MWYRMIPTFTLIAGSASLGGFGLWWLHYFVLGNVRNKLREMWYQILPGFTLIGVCVGLPGWGLYHIHNLVLGNHYRRSMVDRWDRMLYQRDTRLTGDAYTVIGLESIPDK